MHQCFYLPIVICLRTPKVKFCKLIKFVCSKTNTHEMKLLSFDRKTNEVLLTEEEKNYRTSFPVDRTKFKQFTRQFHILSDNTLPPPNPPMKCFFFYQFLEFLSALSYHGY